MAKRNKLNNTRKGIEKDFNSAWGIFETVKRLLKIEIAKSEVKKFIKRLRKK